MFHPAVNFLKLITMKSSTFVNPSSESGIFSKMFHLTCTALSTKVKGARSLRAMRVINPVVVEGESGEVIDNYLKQ
jgi:hypothetical protein